VGPEYRIRVFGGLALDALHPGVAGVLGRGPLSLLAILAVAGGTGISREKICLYLWPDSTNARARNSLYQLLHAVRRTLDRRLIDVGATTCALNRAIVSADLWDFEAALAQASLDEAIALHSGAFLEGFWLPRRPEFERWVEEQRARLMRLYADALEASAAHAARQGHHRLAVQRWQSLVALDPLSSRSAVGLIRALVGAGDRPNALQFARRYEGLVRHELGTGPDPAVVSLLEELRREHAASESVGGRVHPPLEAAPRAPPQIRRRRRGDTAPARHPDPSVILAAPGEQFHRGNGLDRSGRLAGGLVEVTHLEDAVAPYLGSQQEVAVCYAAIDHFKEFSHRYSFFAGERVLQIVARILHDVVSGIAGDRGLVAQVGGRDFLFVVPAELIHPVCTEVVDVFEALIPLQYSEQDRRAGYFFSKNRRGQLQLVPLMILSIGVVTSARRPFGHPAEIREIAYEVKNYARTFQRSMYAVERRTVPPGEPELAPGAV